MESLPRRESEPRRTYRLVARNENDPIEMLTLNRDGEERIPPVFSHEEEAEMFLQLWGRG